MQKIKSHFYSGKSAQIKKLKETKQVKYSIPHQNPSAQVLILKFGSLGPISLSPSNHVNVNTLFKFLQTLWNLKVCSELRPDCGLDLILRKQRIFQAALQNIKVIHISTNNQSNV